MGDAAFVIEIEAFGLSYVSIECKLAVASMPTHVRVRNVGVIEVAIHQYKLSSWLPH